MKPTWSKGSTVRDACLLHWTAWLKGRREARLRREATLRAAKRSKP